MIYCIFCLFFNAGLYTIHPPYPPHHFSEFFVIDTPGLEKLKVLHRWATTMLNFDDSQRSVGKVLFCSYREWCERPENSGAGQVSSDFFFLFLSGFLQIGTSLARGKKTYRVGLHNSAEAWCSLELVKRLTALRVWCKARVVEDLQWFVTASDLYQSYSEVCDKLDTTPCEPYFFWKFLKEITSADGSKSCGKQTFDLRIVPMDSINWDGDLMGDGSGEEDDDTGFDENSDDEAHYEDADGNWYWLDEDGKPVDEDGKPFTPVTTSQQDGGPPPAQDQQGGLDAHAAP
jgi:hypothetical protein